jgi:hypothetical protein
MSRRRRQRRTCQDAEALIAALKRRGCAVKSDGPRGCVLEKTFTSRAQLHVYPDGEIAIFGTDPAAFRAMKALLQEHDERAEVRR